jgi:hypothetical protein
LDIWKTEKLCSQFYHSADHVYTDNDGQEAQIPKHYAVLGFQNAAKMITVEALQERYPDLFTDTDYQGVEQVFMSPSSGGFDATSDLTAVVERAVSKGVRYLQADIDKLSFNEFLQVCLLLLFVKRSILVRVIPVSSFTAAVH